MATLTPEVESKAQAILGKLDTNPLDEAVQGAARAVVAACKESKTFTDMYACSGFFVPPLVRLNCLNNGPCLPLSWGSAGVPNGHTAWWRWQTYADVAEVEISAIGRPWVTTPKVGRACGAKATDRSGKLDESKFALCMVKEMGGDSAKTAVNCYSKWSSAPGQFAACLSEVKLGVSAAKEIECVLAGSSIDSSCAQVFKIPAAAISDCQIKAGGDAAKQALCLGSLPRTLSQTGDCAAKVGGDATLLGHCLKGVAAAMASPQVRFVQQCADALISGKKAEGTQLQIALMQCGSVNADAKSALQTLKKSEVLVACVNTPTMETAAKVKCLEDAGVKLPPQAGVATCLAQAKTALDASVCAGLKGASSVKAVQMCMDSSGGDTAKQALCIGAQAGLPPEQARLVSCASTASSYAAGAACMAGPHLNKDAARAMSCAADSQGSPAGTAICLAGPSMNAELRIAAECLASTGGEPMSFASCAGGRLAMKELQQCISGGFKAENGCFGENNEVVKYFNAQEKVFRGVMKAVGLETAYNNVLGDLKSGKLGDNNDARRVFEAMNRITLQKPAEAAKAIAESAEKAGKAIAGGAQAIQSAVDDAHKVLSTAVQNVFPGAPTALGGGLKTDLPGGGSATVAPGKVEVSAGDVQAKATPTQVQVTVGNSGATVDPSKGKANATVAGVCIGFGCD